MGRLVVVDREAMPIEAWASLLSDREQAEVSTFSVTRRERTVTSRVLVKYLMASPGGPDYRELSAEHISAISPDDLAAVETLSGPARRRTGATVTLGGRPLLEQTVSAAHCGKFTAAGHSRGRLGIDLEKVETRRPEFYRQMFSAGEREWVAEMHECEGVCTDAAFTLLWGVKEAYLKASNWTSLSVWNFSHWSVWVGNEVAAVLQPHTAEVSVAAPGRIESAEVGQTFDIIARRLGGMLLVTVQYGWDREAGKESL